MIRTFLGVVAACFIGLGVGMIILTTRRLIESGDYHGSLESALMFWVAALTPGGMAIILGSVTYMLCSIDARLQDIAKNGQPLAHQKTSDPFAMPPVAVQPPPARQDAGDANHGLF